MDTLTINAIITAASTLFAACIGATLSYLISSRQTKNQLEITERQISSQSEAATLQHQAAAIARMRQEWIERLRNKLSLLTSLISQAESELEHNSAYTMQPDLERQISECQAYILMMINVENPIHEDLHTAVDYLVYDRYTVPRADKLIEHKKRLFSSGRALFKHEWETLKKYKC